MEGQNKGEPSAPLHWAARNGHHAIISAMLKAGEGVNTRDYMQRTALHEASVNGHLETVQALLVAGADVNARDMAQTTPLHDAATKGHHETVRALLVAFADVNAQDFEQSTPLHMAAANGTTETVKTLLKAGADVNAQDREQRTALHLASRNGYDETVRSLLMMAKGRVDLNAFTNQQWTALHLAAMTGQHKAASVLLTAGADVNARDNEQKTALHLAAWNGDWRTVSLLITAGADVNAQDKWCNTPIGEAKKRGHQTCVERLEADKDSRDKGSKQKKGLDPVLIHFYEERGMTTASNKDPLVQEAAKQSGKTVKQVLTFIGYYRQKKGDRKRKSLGDESSNTGAKKGNITADKTNTPGSELPVHGAESVSDQGLNIASSTKETYHERKEKESARVSDHGSAAGESVKAVTEQGPSTSVVVHHHHHHHVMYQPQSTAHLGSACNSRLTGMMPASQTAAAVVNVQDNQGLQTMEDQQRPKAVEALQQGTDKDHKKEGTPKRKKGFDPVLVQFYEGGMTTGSVNDQLVQEAARQTGKTVKQVVNFISNYRRSKGETKHRPPGVDSGDAATKSSIAKMSTADPSHQGVGSSTWQVQTAGSAMDKEERERKEKELCEAAKTGDTAKVKQLLDEGVKPQATSGYMKRTPLHLSAENDHYDIATALLKAGAAVNARDVVERTALHLAAVNGHHNLATALLRAGATVNAHADQQWTPVHLAAMNGHHETVTALHKAGADVNARDNEERIPLHLAANNGYQETVAVLLKAGSNVNTKNNKQRTSMHLAATNGHHETVTLLAAAQNADVNAQDSEKSVPLHEAALHGHPKCVEVLLQHGADIAVRNKEGLSTKDIAKDKDTSSIDTGRKEEVILGRKAILKLLKEESSRIYKRNKEAQAVLIRYYEEKGMTVVKKDCPVIKAAAEESGKSVEQVRNFISNYKRKASSGKRPADEPTGSQSDRVAKESREKMSTADPSDQGAGSSTWQVQTAGSAMDKEEHERKEKELCEAAKTGDTAKVKQLLDEGVKSQVTSGYMKRTPLHLSAENDHYDIATALLKAGAAVNARDVVERTALHLAAVNGHHNLATALLRAGATVNAHADQQWTPVHLAAMNGHHETVTTLHKAGADVNARDNEERIPLHLAANNGYQETVAVLLKAGSNVNTKNNKQRTSMHLAATNGHHETVTLLAAAQNADVNAQDSEQITPLHLASRDGDYETALALLKAGADANVKDKQKSVPLHEAALHSHPKCVEVLLQHGADIAVRNKEGLSTKDIAKDKDTSSIDTGRKEEVILGRKAILKLLQEESSRISNRNKEAQAVLIRYYEEKGMTVVKKDCPLIKAAAEESGKSVEQVRNFISNRKKRASSGKRPADEPAGSLSDTVAKESKDGAKKPRTEARVEDAEKPGCSLQGIETLMEGSIQDGASGSSTDQVTTSLQSKQDISTSATISVLVVNDEYGTAHGGVSTMSREVARLLRKHGAQVYATALKATDDDKRWAHKDDVKLLLPEDDSDMGKPHLDWLNLYHTVHYTNIPRTLQYVVGHADVTSKAAKRIKEQSCQGAKLVLFNHEMPEDTAYFKTTKKAMQAPDKESRILEDAKSADAVFSVGPKIYRYFETNYKSLEEAGPRHYLFLPRASKVFENTNARPGGRQKVVLSFGRVSEVVVQKGHDLAARSLGYVEEHILRNLSWVVRGVPKDEDDWEKSRKILEKKMQKRMIKPTFRSFGTQEDIANDIKRAHLVLMTSRSEPFGLVGLEAIAAGIPVLISDQSGLADMIKDLSKRYKSLADLRHRIVITNVEESAVEETARRWAHKISDTLEYSDEEFEKAAEFKKKLLESKYWEESNNDLLRVCGLIE
ncbi:uncharacterized protein LOC144910212 isoform X5 [Branchiostoma floridae x Branchiostoma belcheri]